MEYSEKAADQTTRIRRTIERLEQTAASPAPNSEAVDAAGLEASALALRPSFLSTGGLGLPRLELPVVKGGLSLRLLFWEQYYTTIHTNAALSTVEKHSYLRRYLAGEADSAVEGLPTTEACYNDAVKMVKRRFCDKRRIEQQHLTALRCLFNVKSATDTKGGRKLYDLTQLNVRGLTTLGVSSAGYSATLCNILPKSLP